MMSKSSVPPIAATLERRAEERNRRDVHRDIAIHRPGRRGASWIGLVLMGAVLSWGASNEGAHAQVASPAPQSTVDPSRQLAPGTKVPNTDIARKSGTLSDKLDAQNGVIHPRRNVDPGMRQPAPRTGAMTVIRPPGSPGAPTRVQPK